MWLVLGLSVDYFGLGFVIGSIYPLDLLLLLVEFVSGVEMSIDLVEAGGATVIFDYLVDLLVFLQLL